MYVTASAHCGRQGVVQSGVVQILSAPCQGHELLQVMFFTIRNMR